MAYERRPSMQRRLRIGFVRPLDRARGLSAALTRIIGAFGLVLPLISAAQVLGQEPAPTPTPTPAPAAEERSTGLPTQVQWKFNFDAGVGWFGFGNSLYTNERPDPSGNLGANWAESYVKPAISGSFGLGKSELFGKLSAVGERTFAAPPPLVGNESSSFQVEDAYLGWRSGTSLGIGENALEFTLGSAQYTIGHGMLLWDGGAEGGERGGYWSNVRKAWRLAAIGRFKPGSSTIEVFYLERNELPESHLDNRLWGANYELALGDTNTLGASYMKFSANPEELPYRDGEGVFNLRAYIAPFGALPDLSFELEYAREENGDLLKSNAWTGLAAYELSTVAWKPKLSYRYAYFEGDKPGTSTNEAFDSLFTGFYDWGTWWQGEIAGEYFLINSNLISHELRIHFTPSDAVGTGLIAYLFRADQPATFAEGVTSKDIAFELDGYCDWKLNKNFSISFIAAYANPQQAVQQAYDRTKNFVYGMVYLFYSY
jgi:hypothetical protein